MTRKWRVYAFLDEEVEADDQFEAEQKGVDILEDAVRAEEIYEEDESETT